MRLFPIVLLVVGSMAQAHDDHLKIQETTGLKSEAVVRNDLRLRGISASDVTLKGRQAEINATVRGKAVRLQMHRQTGTIDALQNQIVIPPVINREINRRIIIQPRLNPNFRLQTD